MKQRTELKKKNKKNSKTFAKIKHFERTLLELEDYQTMQKLYLKPIQINLL